jgi:hypothetical protein
MNLRAFRDERPLSALVADRVGPVSAARTGMAAVRHFTESRNAGRRAAFEQHNATCFIGRMSVNRPLRRPGLASTSAAQSRRSNINDPLREADAQ